MESQYQCCNIIYRLQHHWQQLKNRGQERWLIWKIGETNILETFKKLKVSILKQEGIFKDFNSKILGINMKLIKQFARMII